MTTDTQTSPPPSRATLFANMAKVMGDIKRLSKDGFNGHFKYKYASDSDVADLIRPLLAKYNIAFFASITDVNQDSKRTVVKFDFTFACGDTGATMTQQWVGEANDSQDKGISKAATLAEKYFLLKTFMVSTGDPKDDPDSDGTTDQRQPETSSSNPLDGLRYRVRNEISSDITDKEIAKLANVDAFTVAAFREKYANLGEAFNAINSAFNTPAEPKSQPQPDDKKDVSVSNGNTPHNGSEPAQPALMDDAFTKTDRTYEEIDIPF